MQPCSAAGKGTPSSPAGAPLNAIARTPVAESQNAPAMERCSPMLHGTGNGMTDTSKNPGEKLTVAPSKPLTLKRSVEQGVVRQSFSHGRTKAVVVEKVKRRIGPGEAKAEPAPAAAATAAPTARRAAPTAAPPPAAPAPAIAPKPSAAALPPLTDTH